MSKHTPLVLGLGSDDTGLNLKNYLREQLASNEHVLRLEDFGVNVDSDHLPYSSVGLRVGEAVAGGVIDRAILVCGTGIGMAISANKVRGVRATVAYDLYSVERSVLSNNCQVLTLGSRVIAGSLALAIARQWLALRFDPESRSSVKISVIDEYEAKLHVARET